MSDDLDLFISNGTCYFADNRKADAAMIPCGNDANDHAACCQAGDYCLESSVCFNGDFGVTYVAGCSDPDYEHPSCPDKFNRWDMPWLGMAYCNGSSNEWVLCAQGQKPSSLTTPDPCWCPKNKTERSMTLSQSEVIWYTALLPTVELESISFATGHYPTRKSHPATNTATASSTGAAKSSPDQSISSPTPTAEPSYSATAFAGTDQGNDGSLSPSAKIGAIAGGVAGGLLLGLLFAVFLCLRRRQKKKQLQREEEARAVEDFMHGETKSGAASEPDPLNLGIAVGGGSAASAASSSNPDTPALSELDSKAARPWSLRSELDDHSSARSSYSNGHGGGAGGHGGIGLARSAPSELAAHPIAELPG